MEYSVCKTNCMRYGLSGFYYDSDDNRLSWFQVLRPDGRPSTMARSEVLQGHLPRSEWCVVMNSHECIFQRNIFKFRSSQCSLNMTSSGATSIWMCLITQINTWIGMCLKWRNKNFKSTTCIHLVTTLDMCD